jgi:hypothetical protein
MGFVDKIRQMLGGSQQSERPSPAPEPRVHPGDDPVPAPEDPAPPHGDPLRDQA